MARRDASQRKSPPPSESSDTVMVRVARTFRDFVASKARWGESLGKTLERITRGYPENGKHAKRKDGTE